MGEIFREMLAEAEARKPDMATEKQTPEALSDAEYLRLVARHYAHSPVLEIREHHARLTAIADGLASAQAQQEPVPAELRAIFDGLEFDAGAGRISAMTLYTRMRNLCLAYATPPVQQGPMGREGCNYMCMPGKVCRKCGHVHDIPLTAPPAPAAENPTTSDSPEYTAGWKAGYKHGAWGGAQQPAESIGEPDWDACIREAEVVTGIKVERHTMSIVIREVRRWLAGRTAPQPAERKPLTRQQLREAFHRHTGCTLGGDIELAERVCTVVERAHGIGEAGE